MALRDDSGASLGDELPRPVEEYLQRLPEVRRTAIVLRHALGYSVDEVAELTGVSRNTVKDRLVHARREFRRLVRRDVLTARPLSVEDLRGTPELHDPSMPAPVRTT